MKEMLQNITAEKVGFDLLQEARTTARFITQNPVSSKGIVEITARNIRTYESETLEDSVVSFYPYYRNTFKGERRFFRLDTDREEDLVSASIDPLERDGAVLRGFEKLETQVGKVKDHAFFLWISPRGRAGTQGMYKNMVYGYHQIYMGEVEGENTQACALKCDIDEPILAKWIETVSGGNVHMDNLAAEEFLDKSVVVELGSQTHVLEKVLFILKGILAQNGSNRFYKSVTIDEVPEILKTQKTKQEQEVKIIQQNIVCELALERGVSSEEKIMHVVGNQIVLLYQRYQDKNGVVPLKGCAGGSISINTLLRGNMLSSSSDIFSTDFRLRQASAVETTGICTECGKSSVDNHYHCLNKKCKKRYENETDMPQEQRTKQCSCGFKFNC